MTTDETYTDEGFAQLVKDAEKIGREHGAAAALWWQQDAIGGRNTAPESEVRAAAKKMLEGLEDGDPEVLDSLPASGMSGEWAGSYGMSDLLDDLDVDADSITPEEEGDIFRAYEDGFASGSVDEIESLLRKFLED